MGEGADDCSWDSKSVGSLKALGEACESAQRKSSQFRKVSELEFGSPSTTSLPLWLWRAMLHGVQKRTWSGLGT